MHYLSASIKNLLLAFCITATAFSAQAQWVSIPDTNFGDWLNASGYSQCLQGNSAVGWQMDTTCNKVLSATSIALIGSGLIKSLDGIQYFNGLQILDCSYNQLTSLPGLPNSLTELYCYENQLTAIPALPNSLTSLKCDNNQLTSLPVLPSSLIFLDCDRNQLTSLPPLPNSLTQLACYENQLTALPALPNSLTFLDCSRNQLTALPSLPNSLTNLNCSQNQLTALPALPNSLTNLNCFQNQLTALPALPNSLTRLSCGKNQLTALPALPNSLTILDCYKNPPLTALPALPNSLTQLWCHENFLSALPALPNSLTELYCHENQLTTLPTLPNSLTKLYCQKNQLTSLPALPDSLYQFICNNNPSLSCLPKLGIVRILDFSNTSITCLPNYPQDNGASSPNLNSIPLCDVFNTNGCDVYYNISGVVYRDSIQNCVKDVNERVFDNIKITLSRNGVNEQQVITKTYSTYSFDTDLDTFEMRIDTTGVPYTVACPSSFFYTSILTPQDSMDTDKDFGLRCKPGFDVGVLSAVRDSGTLFPAQQGGIHVKAGDLSSFYGLNCAAVVSGAVSITYSGPVSFAGTMSGALAPVVSGNTLTYTIADFGAIDMQKAFGLRFLVDTFAQVGQQLCLEVVVTPTAGDNNVSNNTATYCFAIVNSYDPNMKEVSPVNTIAPDEDWLTYTIHFQNMGNAPAIHIYVMDTLDNNLDESSIQILGSSHRMLTEIKGNIARFNFPNINLVDSATNEPESKGWLQYKIKKNSNLALGSQIKNTASIYFDFNAPVVTNTVTNTVEQPSAVSFPSSEGLGVGLYPNPTNNDVFITYSSNTSADVTLFNINGAACLKQQLTASNQSISLSGLPAGVYFVSVEIQGSVVRKKVVKW